MDDHVILGLIRRVIHIDTATGAQKRDEKTTNLEHVHLTRGKFV